jgi:hypothetical protein
MEPIVETPFISLKVMQAEMPELSTWRFVSIPDEAGNQAKMELGVNSITSRGTLVNFSQIVSNIV